MVIQKLGCSAVIFDLWDTLVQAKGITRNTQQKMGLGGMPFSEFIRRFEKAFMLKSFLSFKEAFVDAFQEFGLKPDEFLIAGLEKTWTEHVDNASLFPEILSVLKQLKENGFRLGIVSNCQWFRTREMLDRLELSGLLDGISLSFEVGALKPDARIFRDCLKQMNVFAEETVMVGDSDTDILGAQAAGIRGIFLDRSAFKIAPREAVATVNSLKELLGILETKRGGW